MIISSEGEDKTKKLCKLEELNNLDCVYSADSFRAIGTAKYIAETNNLKIKLDKRINKRDLEIKKISESLNEVDYRFNSFLEEILNSNYDRVAIFIHGII